MTEVHKILEDFENLANEYFFTLSPKTLPDAVQAFCSLTIDLEMPDFIKTLSKAQQFLLIKEPDVLANELLTFLASDTPEIVCFALSLLPRCLSQLQPDELEDGYENIVSALEIFDEAGQEKPVIAAIICLSSNKQNYGLQEWHISAFLALLSLKLNSTVVESLAMRAAIELSKSSDFQDFFRVDDVEIINTCLQKILENLRAKHSDFLVNMALQLLKNNTIVESFLRAPEFLSVLFNWLGCNFFKYQPRIRAIFAEFLLLDAFMGESAENDSQNVVNLLEEQSRDKKSFILELENMVQERFDQYLYNYKIPVRLVEKMKFYIQ